MLRLRLALDTGRRLQGGRGAEGRGPQVGAAAWRQDGALAARLPRLGKRRCCTAGCKQAPKDRRQPSGPGSLASLEQGLGTRARSRASRIGLPGRPWHPQQALHADPHPGTAWGCAWGCD